MKRRGKEYKLIIVLVFITVVIISALNLGNGITGMATFDSNVKPLCTSDSDCSGGEVCCVFHGENAGICNVEDLCPKIDEMTKDTEYYSDQLLSDYKKSKEKESTFFQVFLGIVLLLFAVFLFYIILHEEDDEEEMPKKRKYKKKRVGAKRKKK